MSIVTLEKNLVHYEALGRGRPLVFVHGWLGSWRYWWSSMQSLSNVCRSFALDLWGFGDSSRVPSSYDIDAYAKLLGGFRHHLGLAQPVTFVGHALGAAVALRHAAASPDGINGVVVVSPPFGSSQINQSLFERFDQQTIARQLNLNSDHHAVLSEITKIDMTAVAETVGQVDDFNLVEVIKEMECPVLLLEGDRDPVVGAMSAELGWSCDFGPNVHCLTLEECEHFPMLENPAVFNRLLKDFVHGRELNDIAPKVYWTRRMR